MEWIGEGTELESKNEGGMEKCKIDEDWEEKKKKIGSSVKKIEKIRNVKESGMKRKR